MSSKILITSLIILAIILAPKALAKTLKVAVIDTGIDSSIKHQCKGLSKDFSGEGPYDNHGHGTHIAGLINRNAGKTDYCLVAIKFYSSYNSGDKNVRAMVNSINYAIQLNVDYINISGGGVSSNEEERQAIKKALDKGIKVVVAAGNENHNLNLDCNYYPACYDSRLVVVGNLLPIPMTSRSPSSNYGRIVTRWEFGTNVLSDLPGGLTGKMTGTSQATAIVTGKLLSK